MGLAPDGARVARAAAHRRPGGRRRRARRRRSPPWTPHSPPASARPAAPRPSRCARSAPGWTSCPDGRSALAIISVPGQYAVAEAADAIAAGRSVLVFSDGVPVEHEVALKDAARDAGRARHGPRLRHRDRLRCRARVRQRRPARAGGAGRRLRHRCPAGLLPARRGRRRRLARARRRRPRSVRGRRRAARRSTRSPRSTPTRPPSGCCWSPSPRRRRSRRPCRRPRPNSRCRCAPPSSRPRAPDLTAAVEALLRDMGLDVPPWPSRPGPATSAVPGATLKGLYSGGTLADEAMLIAAPALGDIRSNTPLKPELDARGGPVRHGPRGHRLRGRRPDRRPGAPDDRPDAAARGDREPRRLGRAGGAAAGRRPRVRVRPRSGGARSRPR